MARTSGEPHTRDAHRLRGARKSARRQAVEHRAVDVAMMRALSPACAGGAP